MRDREIGSVRQSPTSGINFESCNFTLKQQIRYSARSENYSSTQADVTAVVGGSHDKRLFCPDILEGEIHSGRSFLVAQAE
jgi:hypothetical protein